MKIGVSKSKALCPCCHKEDYRTEVDASTAKTSYICNNSGFCFDEEHLVYAFIEPSLLEEATASLKNVGYAMVDRMAEAAPDDEKVKAYEAVTKEYQKIVTMLRELEGKAAV